MDTPKPAFYERLFRQIGWLQPGQPLHEAEIPQDLLDRYPGAASLLQERANHPSPATPEFGEGSGPGSDTGDLRDSSLDNAPGTTTPTPSVSTLESEPEGIPESETPGPKQKKRSRKHCRGITRAGNLCYAYKMFAGDLCVFHNAKAVNESAWHDLAEQFDPEKIAEAKTASLDLELLPVQLHDTEGLLAFTEGILRLELSGSLPHSTSRRIASYLRIAQRALPSGGESRTMSEPEQHQVQVEHFIRAAPAIRDRLDKQDLYRRDLDAEDVRRKRESILKLNRQYAPPPQSKLPKLRSMLSY